MPPPAFPFRKKISKWLRRIPPSGKSLWKPEMIFMSLISVQPTGWMTPGYHCRGSGSPRRCSGFSVWATPRPRRGSGARSPSPPWPPPGPGWGGGIKLISLHYPVKCCASPTHGTPHLMSWLFLCPMYHISVLLSRYHGLHWVEELANVFIGDRRWFLHNTHIQYRVCMKIIQHIQI